MRKYLAILSILYTLFTVHAEAQSEICKSAVLADRTCFQKGDVWGKTKVPDNSVIQTDPHLLSIFNGTFQTMLGGSGILLGKFKNKYVAATAYHTCVKAVNGKCNPFHLSSNFRVIGLRLKAESILGQWPELDLVLFTLQVNNSEEEKLLLKLGRNFAFRAAVKEGTLLTVSGYSPIENDNGFLQITQDADCRVLSKTNEFRLLNDPDSLQPDEDKKWAFAMGCDVARGDSGGPVVDKNTGDIFGLVWTGAYPANPKLQNSAVIKEVLNYFPEVVWSEFAYVVPASKILDQLTKTISDKTTAPETKQILTELVAP